jgi:hypothetical protein
VLETLHLEACRNAREAALAISRVTGVPIPGDIFYSWQRPLKLVASLIQAVPMAVENPHRVDAIAADHRLDARLLRSTIGGLKAALGGVKSFLAHPSVAQKMEMVMGSQARARVVADGLTTSVPVVLGKAVRAYSGASRKMLRFETVGASPVIPGETTSDTSSSTTTTPAAFVAREVFSCQFATTLTQDVMHALTPMVSYYTGMFKDEAIPKYRAASNMEGGVNWRQMNIPSPPPYPQPPGPPAPPRPPKPPSPSPPPPPPPPPTSPPSSPFAPSPPLASPPLPVVVIAEAVAPPPSPPPYWLSFSSPKPPGPPPPNPKPPPKPPKPSPPPPPSPQPPIHKHLFSARNNTKSIQHSVLRLFSRVSRYDFEGRIKKFAGHAPDIESYIKGAAKCNLQSLNCPVGGGRRLAHAFANTSLWMVGIGAVLQLVLGALGGSSSSSLQVGELALPYDP